MRIGIVFGSTTGNTEDAADAISEWFAEHIDKPVNVEGLDLDTLTTFDVLLVGVPTWDIGELQESWSYVIDELEDRNFDNTRVAFFGDGDQSGYAENFQDAMGTLRDIFVERGATADLGHWPVDDYDFVESHAVRDGKFVGLALDELNQSELTESRVKTWCMQIKKELQLTIPG